MQCTKNIIPASSYIRPQRPGNPCTPFPILASPLLVCQSSHLEMALDSVALPTTKDQMSMMLATTM